MPRGRPAASGLSISQLEKMLSSGLSRLAGYQRKRQTLENQMAGIDAKIAELGGQVRRGRPPAIAKASAVATVSEEKTSASKSKRGTRKRPKNAKSLLETITEVLTSSGTPMKVSDIVDACVLGGYKSSSPQFRGIVNQALIKDKRFEQINRGTYGLKKGAK